MLKGLYDVERGGTGLSEALEDLRLRASESIARGARTLVISDRDSDHTLAPIPSLLAVAAVHHHLVRTKERTKVALVVETGDAREVHHMALLIGYGAAAVNPYLAFESIEDLIREGELTGIEPAAAVRNYLKALGKGVMKVMSKMGISTVGSYTGAQAFEAIGLDQAMVDEYLEGTVSQLGGVGLDVLAEEVRFRHRRAYPENPTERAHRRLSVGGEYQFRRDGELHLFTPETVFLLQHSTRTGRADVFANYTDEVDRLSREGGTLRGLFGFRTGVREPVPLDEVESVDAICTRFNTGAMSYGSISAEAHETMAIAMNNLGGRSNSGEGGEDVGGVRTRSGFVRAQGGQLLERSFGAGQVGRLQGEGGVEHPLALRGEAGRHDQAPAGGDGEVGHGRSGRRRQTVQGYRPEQAAAASAAPAHAG